MGTRVDPTNPVRLTIEQLIEQRKSMLLGPTPYYYGAIETGQDALAAAVPPPKAVTLRMHIVWDNPATDLDLEGVLARMRETGAAMVVKVEEVS